MIARLARWVSDAVGQPAAFVAALALVLAWAASGPAFGWSATWQLIINTTTTVVTFLMVFLIQHAQNLDTRAMERKLDEIIRALPQADNHLIGIERHDDAPAVLE